jgi:hypothetical protein
MSSAVISFDGNIRYAIKIANQGERNQWYGKATQMPEP